MQVLRQSTAVDVLIGPFTDVTDGVTEEVGESPAVRLSKNGQALANKNDATTPVFDDDGCYNCELDATDTATIGTLVLSVLKSANAGPIRHEYQVIDESAYDAIYASPAIILTSLDIGLIYESTVEIVNSQTNFDMDEVIQLDDAWIGHEVTYTDVSTGESYGGFWVTDSKNTDDELTINAAAPFTVIANDVIRVSTRMAAKYILTQYDPPTRTEATADLTDIRDYVQAMTQLLARNDSFIATDRSSELADINENEGSGVGDYAPATDAQEKLAVDVAAILVDTGTTLEAKINSIKTITDQFVFTAANLIDANALAISGSTGAADKLEEFAESLIVGSAVTGTLTTTACTTDLSGYANEELKGRRITFKSGTADGESAIITAYENTNGRIFYERGIATAPANGDLFVIV